MANELQTKLDAILLDKNTNLLPENLKKNVTVLGITGTLETGGIDTSDATANANDLALNKTAYVNGEKIEGNIYVASSKSIVTGGKFTEDTKDLAVCHDMDLLLRTGGAIEITEEQVAAKGNITPEKIVKGNTIFGVEGTAETEQSLTLDELPLEGLGDDFIDKHNYKFEFTDYDTNVIQNISYAEDMNGIFPIFKDLDIVKIGVIGATGNNSYPYIITKLKENQSTYYMGYFSVTVNYTDGTKKQTSSDNTYLTGRTYGEYMVYSTSEMSINLIPNISKENISNIKITMQNIM